MCLINFQFHNHSIYPLILVANRDESYHRPTQSAHFWEDEPSLLAGRDLLQMGTWLGITKKGRFAALTNYRDPSIDVSGKISRGELVKNYLTSNKSPQQFLEQLKKTKDHYGGYNILFGNVQQLFHYNNILDETNDIFAGVHGLSNATLNTPWPKVRKGKQMLNDYTSTSEKIDKDQLFQIISDSETAPDEELPNTGVGMELERMLSPLFIRTADYGTRSSTVLLIDQNHHVTFVERVYDQGESKEENDFSFPMVLE